MLSIVKWTIISLVLIMLVHHLYNFLQGTLTVPKTRDLVNRPAARYREIIAALETQRGIQRTDSPEMKDELAAFLRDLKKSDPTKNSNNSLPQPLCGDFTSTLTGGA